MKAAENAARLAPDSELVLAELAEAALEAGQLDRAEEVAARLVGTNPTAVEPLLTRGAVFVARKQWDRAEDDYRAALRIHPQYPQARLMLGVCLYHRGNPEAGRKEAETAIGLATNPRQKAALQEWYERQTR